MSNAISLDNQTFLSYLVDSFMNFFQLQKSFIGFVISLSFSKQYGRLVKDQFIHYYLSTCTCQLTYHHVNSCTTQQLLFVQKMDY